VIFTAAFSPELQPLPRVFCRSCSLPAVNPQKLYIHTPGFSANTCGMPRHFSKQV